MTGDDVIRGIMTGEKAFTGPELAVLDLTNRCNLRCIGCWNRSPLLSPGSRGRAANSLEMEPDVARELVRTLASMGVREINFSGGGEPLLYSPLFDLIRSASDSGVSCTLNTNFSLVDEPVMEKIIEAGTAKVLASVWAGSAEVYERTHPGAGKDLFDRISRMLGLMVRKKRDRGKPHLTIVNVVSNQNISDFEDMIKFAIDVGADGVWFTPVDAPERGMENLLLSGEQLHWIRDFAPRCVEKYDNLPLGDGRRFRIQQADGFLEKISSSRATEGYYHWDVIDTLPCYAGWVTVRILASGDVCPCCKADRFPLGNIYESGFAEIWYSEGYARFRRRALSESKKADYFSRINCPRICDNWWQIKEVHERLKAEKLSGR